MYNNTVYKYVKTIVNYLCMYYKSAWSIIDNPCLQLPSRQCYKGHMLSHVIVVSHFNWGGGNVNLIISYIVWESIKGRVTTNVVVRTMLSVKEWTLYDVTWISDLFYLVILSVKCLIYYGHLWSYAYFISFYWVLSWSIIVTVYIFCFSNTCFLTRDTHLFCLLKIWV